MKFNTYSLQASIPTGILAEIGVLIKHRHSITLIHMKDIFIVYPAYLLILVALVVAFYSGWLIDRLSSVVLEEVCKKLKIFKWSKDYKAYKRAEADNPYLKTLSSSYRNSRRYATLFLLLSAYSWQDMKLAIGCLVLAVAFILSARKHTSKIVNICNAR